MESAHNEHATRAPAGDIEGAGSMNGRLYLTFGEDTVNGRGYVCVISDGSPQVGDKHVTVLAVDYFKDLDGAKAWFAKMKIDRPWEPRQ